MAKQHPTIIAIGKNKGHPTTKLAAKQTTVRPSRSKGKLGKRVSFIRSLVGEVAGVAGYEKRIIELLKAGSLRDTKKALKVAKKALGTHTRAKIKRENLMNLIRAQQKAVQDKKK
jgi:large subunit ribosomal protein L36e